MGGEGPAGEAQAPSSKSGKSRGGGILRPSHPDVPDSAARGWNGLAWDLAPHGRDHGHEEPENFLEE